LLHAGRVDGGCAALRLPLIGAEAFGQCRVIRSAMTWASPMAEWASLANDSRRRIDRPYAFEISDFAIVGEVCYQRRT
jgi:hypothetical protein